MAHSFKVALACMDILDINLIASEQDIKDDLSELSGIVDHSNFMPILAYFFDQPLAIEVILAGGSFEFMLVQTNLKLSRHERFCSIGNVDP